MALFGFVIAILQAFVSKVLYQKNVRLKICKIV